MAERVWFLPEITLSRSEVFDVAAECDAIIEEAEGLGAVWGSRWQRRASSGSSWAA